MNLNVPVGANETITFSEGSTFVRILENVRKKDTFIVQTTVFPTNDNFMELLFYVRLEAEGSTEGRLNSRRQERQDRQLRVGPGSSF